MLSFDTVHALTAGLLHLLHNAPSGPGAPEPLGTIVLAQDHPASSTCPHLRHLRILQLPLLGDGCQHQSLPEALHQTADTLIAHGDSRADRRFSGNGPLHPDDLDFLRYALHTPLPGQRLLAWAVRYDDLLADAEQLAYVRRVEAVDVDGRVYQFNLHHGEDHPVVLVDEQHDPDDDIPATYPPLARLAAAAHRTAGHR